MMLSLVEWQHLPVRTVEVTPLYHPDMLIKADKKAICKYKKLLKKNSYIPIFLNKQDNFVVDGTHRVIAAFQLGLKTIKAHCNE